MGTQSLENDKLALVLNRNLVEDNKPQSCHCERGLPSVAIPREYSGHVSHEPRLYISHKTLKLNMMRLLILFLCFFIGCSKENKVPVVSSEEANLDTRETISDFKLEAFAYGKKQWNLEGERAVIDQDSNNVSVKNPHVIAYENNRKVSRLSAKEADVNTKTKNINAKGDVFMSSYKDDVSVRAETMKFDSEKNKFFSDGLVRIERGDSITTGIGLEATKDMSEVIVKNNVNITYKE